MIVAERVTSKPLQSSDDWNRLGPSERDEQETDRILSAQLLRLSFNERNTINEEIHGVRNDFPEHKEEPESQQLSLYDMECAVESILPDASNKNTASGLRLEHLPTNRELKLTFLRCERYNVVKAARRFVTYIRFIRELCPCGEGVASVQAGDCFGDGGRMIAKKWFTPEEYVEMKKGVIQLMPFRDQAGRRVLVALAACFKLCEKTRIKIVLFLISGASEDEESQKNGFVVLIWPGTCPSITPYSGGMFESLSNRRYSTGIQQALPLRLVCVHFANAASPLLKLARIMLVALTHENIRSRFNIMTGTQVELNYRIMGYGIPPAMIPTTENGAVKARNHVQWLETRQRIEQNPYGSSEKTKTGGAAVECPGSNDVLFHRGKSCQHHPGNVAFRGMIEARKDRHLTANQTLKKELAWDIMEEVEKRKGRFLYWDKSGWWMEFDNRTEVRHKVATSLRDFNKKSRAANNRQRTHSSTRIFQVEESRKKRRLDNDERDNGESSSDCSCDCIQTL